MNRVSEIFTNELTNSNSHWGLVRVPDKIWEVVEPIFWVIAGIFNVLTDFFTQGLSDFLVLDTLRHGTSWRNYVNIRMRGADPSLGGGAKGSCAGIENEDPLISKFIKIPLGHDLRKNSAGYFFVFAGSTLGEETRYMRSNADGTTTPDVRRFSFMQKCLLQLYVRWEPHAIAFMAGVSQACHKDAKGVIPSIQRIWSGLYNMFAPVLKIHMREADVGNYFETDPLLPGRALRTRCKIGTEFMGLKGIFTQANDGYVLERIAARPLKSLWGLIRLINPIGVALILGFGIYHCMHAFDSTHPSVESNVQKALAPGWMPCLANQPAFISRT